MKRKISVVIPSFNSGKTIEYTLRALNDQTKKNLISEIIVVDSSDDEVTKRILNRYKSNKIKVVNAGKKAMPAISRNIGASDANGEILAFIDADAYPAPDWLENILKAYEKGYLVGGGTIELSDFQKNNPLAIAQYHLQFNEYMPGRNNSIRKFITSCNMFCDKKLFQKVGGFPEIRAAEDVLFSLNISKIDKLCYVPSAKVHHIFRQGLKPFLQNQMLLGEYAIKYRRWEVQGKFYYKNLWPLLFLPAFLIIKLFGITLRILSTKPSSAMAYLITFPIFFVGLIFWAFGFAKGTSKDTSRIKT